MYYNKNMRNILFFTIYIIFFAVLSSLIFTLLYMQFDEQPMLALNKAIKYGAILMCALFIVPAMKINKLYKRELVGYLEIKGEFILNIFKGFLISLALLLPLIFSFLYLGIRTVDFSQFIFDKLFIYTILYFLFISFLISLIEESFFRGILIQIQKRVSMLSSAKIIIFSSLIYSLFHFIKIPLIVDDNLLWNSGISELLKVFLNFNNILIIDAAITLLFFGILLGIIRVNLNTISYGIGLHAGFIFTIKTFKSNSLVDFDSDYVYLLSSYDHFTGYLSAVWIAILLLIYLIFLYIKNNRDPLL